MQFSKHLLDKLFAGNNYVVINNAITQQAGYVKTMLFLCWATVYNAGPTLKQHCFRAPREHIYYYHVNYKMVFNVTLHAVSSHDAVNIGLTLG